jgi:hypothetical protein
MNNKISVHITYYQDSRANLKRNFFLKKVIFSYLSISKNVEIFISIKENDKNGKKVITSGFDFHDSYWENPTENTELKIENFKLKIKLDD